MQTPSYYFALYFGQRPIFISISDEDVERFSDAPDHDGIPDKEHVMFEDTRDNDLLTNILGHTIGTLEERVLEANMVIAFGTILG